MTVLSLVAGAALLTLVTVDILVTMLHPTARGPLCQVANRGAWLLTRGLARILTSPRPMGSAGGLGMALTFGTWLMGLATGYALLYLPFIDSFSYSPTVPFGDKTFIDAL